MSHHATSWAIKAGSGCGLTAAAKLVLWQLADRHNPDLGCFPTQDRLAEDCEISRSQVNVHLANLEKLGLIRRSKQFDPKTNQQRPTRYMLAFEKGFEALPTVTLEPAQADLPLEEEPCLETGHGSMSDFEAKPCLEIGHGAVSGFEAKPCPILRQSRVRPTGHKPVIEPVREPFVFANGSAEAEKAFAEFWKVHPRPRNRDKTRHLFLQALIAGEEAARIIGGARRFATEQVGNRAMYVCQSDKWIEKSRWEDFEAKAEAEQAPSSDTCASPVATFWATAVKAKKFIPANAISPALAREIIEAGLCLTDELVGVGVKW